MSKLRSGACALVAIAALVVASCGGSDDDGGRGSADKQETAVVAKARDGLDALKRSVLSTGPNGEKPTPASEVSLSAQELQQIKDKHATAAIVLHYGGNDWSNAQVNGLRVGGSARHPILLSDARDLA